MNLIRRYFFSGLLAIVPLWITLLIIRFLVELFDNSLSLLPKVYRPEALLGFSIPGLGLLFAFAVVIFSGFLITHFLGQRIVELWERILSRIPLVRTIYQAVKQVLSTVLSTSEDSFRKVLLIEYPRKGLWSIAFQTSAGLAEAQTLVGKQLVTVFVPTTPNPTSGFLLLVPVEDTHALDVSVDQALRMVISLGVVLPDQGAVATPKKQGENYA